jgi:hypothetical protein
MRGNTLLLVGRNAYAVSAATAMQPLQETPVLHEALTNVHRQKELLRYIRHYSKLSRAVKWKYADPSRHISTQSVGTGH